MGQGTQHSADDERNARILIHVNGVLKPRVEATVSVFDRGFVPGDGVWEGFRVVGGRPAFLEAHLDHLYEGAKAIALDIGLDRDQFTRARTPARSAARRRGRGLPPRVRSCIAQRMRVTPE